MPVKEADPGAKTLDAAFAEAMGAPPRPKEPKAPPEIDPDAPHGRDENGVPLAPHGLTKDGRPRKTAAGRPAKDDKARTGPPAHGQDDKKDDPAAAGHDYAPALTEAADAAWFLTAAVGVAGGKIPVVGKWVPDKKIAAQAVMLRAFQPQLVGAMNLAAQHNDHARKFARKCEDGTISWVLVCGFTTLPFLTASLAIWQGDKALAEHGMPLLEELAKQNEAELDEFVAQMAGQLQEAPAEAAAALAGQEAQ